jgi:hypothetical protein
MVHRWNRRSGYVKSLTLVFDSMAKMDFFDKLESPVNIDISFHIGVFTNEQTSLRGCIFYDNYRERKYTDWTGHYLLVTLQR